MLGRHGPDRIDDGPPQAPRRRLLGGRLRDLLRRDLRGRGQRRLQVGTELVDASKEARQVRRAARLARRDAVRYLGLGLDVLDELDRQFLRREVLGVLVAGPVWKSNFGRSTPSTRRCPRGRVGSMA
jgi:hypothetical protein